MRSVPDPQPECTSPKKSPKKSHTDSIFSVALVVAYFICNILPSKDCHVRTNRDPDMVDCKPSLRTIEIICLLTLACYVVYNQLCEYLILAALITKILKMGVLSSFLIYFVVLFGVEQTCAVIAIISKFAMPYVLNNPSICATFVLTVYGGSLIRRVLSYLQCNEN
jgi:hypothetical protein